MFKGFTFWKSRDVRRVWSDVHVVYADKKELIMIEFLFTARRKTWILQLNPASSHLFSIISLLLSLTLCFYVIGERKQGKGAKAGRADPKRKTTKKGEIMRLLLSVYPFLCRPAKHTCTNHIKLYKRVENFCTAKTSKKLDMIVRNDSILFRFLSVDLRNNPMICTTSRLYVL